MKLYEDIFYSINQPVMRRAVRREYQSPVRDEIIYTEESSEEKLPYDRLVMEGLLQIVKSSRRKEKHTQHRRRNRHDPG